MVINPKGYQKAFKWCVESALEIIYNKVFSLGEKISKHHLSTFYSDELKSYGTKNHDISRLICDLKRSGYIQVDHSDSVIFTNKAKMRIVDRIAHDRIKDKKLYLVSFDIPEIKRAGRNQFRRVIKRLGFRQVHKSLWIADRNVGDLVEMAAIEYRVNNYVAYFVSEYSNINSHIVRILKKPGK